MSLLKFIGVWSAIEVVGSGGASVFYFWIGRKKNTNKNLQHKKINYVCSLLFTKENNITLVKHKIYLNK
jgi:hypothetical protein